MLSMLKLRRPGLYGSSLLNILLLVFVSGLLVASTVLVRSKMLQNAQDLGMALAHSYAVEEEATLKFLESNFVLACSFVDEIADSGGSAEDIQSWLQGYYPKFAAIIGEGVADFYAVIDGNIVAANPWEGDGSYDYASAGWYLSAVGADGNVVMSGIYTDAVTGRQVLTFSQYLPGHDYVLAMDVQVQDEALRPTLSSLPEDCSYFLCGAQGEPIYSRTKWQLEPDELEAYMGYIMDGIESGELLSYDAFVEDTEGVMRGVYYQTMGNGWTVVLTIPLRSILLGEPNSIVYLTAGVSLALFISIAYLTLQSAVRYRRLRKADDTAHMLGDSFYSIYRVDFRQGSYEGIKIYTDLTSRLPERGSYSQLLETMRPLVKPSTFRAFEESFSLESIRERAELGIADYGGDYQRLFGDNYRWVNIRTLYDRQLAPDEVILCFRDVDEEKRGELQNTIILQDALDAAQESTRAKSAFFSRMSHDMRTPLNAILGCCSLAEKCRAEGEGERVWDYLRKIRFSGAQLQELIEDILELSRLEAGQRDADRKLFDLRRLICDTAELFRERAQLDGKTFELALDFSDDWVIGDEKKLVQILNNLLSNACKYSAAGDSIRLEARQFDFQQHSKYQIVVEDTGVGMSPEFLERLFEPYTRETAFYARSTTGTGLGMAIVKSLVQQLGGEISVESRLGEGSRFTVTLPLTAASGQAEGEGEAEAPAEPEALQLEGRTVLVAEDNELNLEITAELLRQFGMQVLCAEDGRRALELFEAGPPFSIDAILMDMQMPVMDGCEAASAIRALDRADAAGVPIIAVTANVYAEDIARSTMAGMDDHVSKPIDGELLRRTLQKLIAARSQG